MIVYTKQVARNCQRFLRERENHAHAQIDKVFTTRGRERYDCGYSHWRPILIRRLSVIAD